jgi:hypothetical protein
MSESFVLLLYVVVTSVKGNMCQAKAYCGGVKYFQARLIIILPWHRSHAGKVNQKYFHDILGISV